MNKEELGAKVNLIKSDNKQTFEITPRDLINALGCERRTKNNSQFVNNYLNDHNLETIPNYLDVWVDSIVVLRHKEKATTKTEVDPIKRIQLLKAASTKPITINNDADISKAITLMLSYDYSQLPITSDNRNIQGHVSWETIAKAWASGKNISKVSDCADKNITIIPLDKSLLDSFKIINENGFVLVKGIDNSICGIVTVADISSVLGDLIQPFLLLESVEKNLRLLLNGVFLKEHLLEMFPDQGHNSIDDLTFGDYIRIIENEEKWKLLELPIDRVTFKNELEKVRIIRNDIMHFDPDGFDSSDIMTLRNVSNLISELRKWKS